MVKEKELIEEFATYFKSIEREVEAESVSWKGGRGKPTYSTAPAGVPRI